MVPRGELPPVPPEDIPLVRLTRGVRVWWIAAGALLPPLLSYHDLPRPGFHGHFPASGGRHTWFWDAHEKNANRHVATHDRYEAIRAVPDQVMMEIRWDGHRRKHRSHLSDLLDIANGTRRRISAVCAVRYEDWELNAKPYGKIRWPATRGKTGGVQEPPSVPAAFGASWPIRAFPPTTFT